MNVFYKKWVIVEILLILVCISFYISYTRNINEDQNLKNRFDQAHSTEILQNKNEFLRIEYNYEVESAKSDFYYQLKKLEIEYKRNTGTITDPEYDNRFQKLIDEELQDSKKHLDTYISSLDNIKFVEYRTSDELIGKIRTSKILSRITFVLAILIGVVLIFKYL